MITFHKKRALILIDWQEGILNLTQLPQKDQIHQNVVQLVRSFQDNKHPVAFVTVMPDGAWLKTPKEIPTSNKNLPDNFAALHPDLKPTANDWLIRKHQWSAFIQTKLPELLKEHKITQLFFAGISTSIGVEGSVRDASPLGYELVLVTDAMLDMDQNCHNHSVENIFPRLGLVTQLKEVIKKV